MSQWENWPAVLLERKKKRREKEKERKKKSPSRKQSKTDEANLFTQSHRNGIENVQNTAQPACSFCFNGDESNFRLKDFLTFRERRGVSKLGPLLGYKGLFRLKATVYALVVTTILQIHIVTCCIHHTLRTPYPFS